MHDTRRFQNISLRTDKYGHAHLLFPHGDTYIARMHLLLITMLLTMIFLANVNKPTALSDSSC